jgi:hypothetical protein
MLSSQDYQQKKVISSRDGNRMATILHMQTADQQAADSSKKSRKKKKNKQSLAEQAGDSNHRHCHHEDKSLTRDSSVASIDAQGNKKKGKKAASAGKSSLKALPEQFCLPFVLGPSSSSKPQGPPGQGIWYKSDAEEKERIREFWLSLSEDDRRSLVKLEKEAVLKKMKEQQRHTCSCTVCGKKRQVSEYLC